MLFTVSLPQSCHLLMLLKLMTSSIFCEQVGYISFCAVQLFLQMFLIRGSAKLCDELPKEAAPQPRDIYNRALKEYWFKFTTLPSQHLEKVFLQFLEELVPPTSESQKRHMSPLPASMATATNPFLLFQYFATSTLSIARMDFF